MATIGIFDSGSGGLSVLREIRKVLASERYVYYADNANCPYGEKSVEFIRDRARWISRFLLDKGAEVIIVACNTATGAAISVLREEFDVPFIGMEPAIKPAVDRTVTGVVGVLATHGTLNAEKYRNTRDRFGTGVRIVEHVGEGFVDLVERLELDGPETSRVVRESVRPLVEQGADVIVLGCTHYPFLGKVIAREAGEGVTVVDPAPAVARHLKDVLRDHGIPEGDSSPGVELHSSGPGDSLKALYEMMV